MNPINILRYGLDRHKEIVKWAAEYDNHEEQQRKYQVRSINVPLSVLMNRRQRPF